MLVKQPLAFSVAATKWPLDEEEQEEACRKMQALRQAKGTPKESLLARSSVWDDLAPGWG